MDVDVGCVIGELAHVIPPFGNRDLETAMFVGYQAINGMLQWEEDCAHFELSWRAYQNWFHRPLKEFAQFRELHQTLCETFPGQHPVLWLEGSPQTGDFRAVYREDGTVLLPGGEQQLVFPVGSNKIGHLIWDLPGRIVQEDRVVALFERPHSNPGEGPCPVEEGFGVSVRGIDVRCAQSLMATEVFSDEALRLRRMVAERKLCRQKRVDWPLDDKGRALVHQLGGPARLDAMAHKMSREELLLERVLLRPAALE